MQIFQNINTKIWHYPISSMASQKLKQKLKDNDAQMIADFKQAAETKPAKQAAETKPAKQAAETKPAKQAAETKPAKQAAETKPAKQAAETKPAKQAAETAATGTYCSILV